MVHRPGRCGAKAVCGGVARAGEREAYVLRTRTIRITLVACRKSLALPILRSNLVRRSSLVATTPVRRRYNSEQLFGDQTEVDIQHGEWTYRLRLTSLGKLILTK